MSINFTNRLSATTTDSAGVTHLVWVENAAIWHAVYDDNAGTWKDAKTIAEVGTQSLTSLNLVANDKLIGGSSPGLAVVYQQGNENESDFFYTAAQYNASGKLQWLASPQNLNADQVGDLEPRAIANSDGTVFVVGQKVNTDNANNFSSREDTDLYYQSFTVNPNQFPTPAFSLNSPTIANYNPQAIAIQALAKTVKQVNNSSFNGWGFNWNGSQSFDTNLLSAFGSFFKTDSQDTTNILGKLFDKLNISGTLQASTGNNPEFSLFGGGLADTSGLLLNAIASIGYQTKLNEKEDADKAYQGTAFKGAGQNIGFNASVVLATFYSFAEQANTDGTYPFKSETGSLSISAGLSVPVIDYGPLFVNLLGSLGVTFQWQLSPSASDSSYEPPLAPYLLPGGSGESTAALVGAISIPPVGALSAIVLALVSDISEIVDSADKSEKLTLDSLLVGIPVAVGLEGGLNIPDLFQATVSGKLFLDGTFGKTNGQSAGTFTLGIPLTATIKAFGFLGGTVEYFPSWTWGLYGSTSSLSNANASPTLPGTDLAIANVTGSLLTLNFASPLDSDIDLNPDEFSVAVTDVNGFTTFIPVFGVVIQEDRTSVTLRLEQTIPYGSLNGEAFADIDVTYTGSQSLEGFNDGPVPVSNLSPQNFVYTYNPTGGNNENYLGGTNQIVINFNTQLNSQIVPAVSNFTVTANNSNVAVTAILGVTQNTVTLGLASSITDSYTVTYTPGSSSVSNLQDSRNNPLPTFTINNGASSDSNLVNNAFTNSISTNNVISSITGDFAQDASPALALSNSSNGNILLAWGSDTPPLQPISAVAISNQILLTFAQNLNENSTPLLSQFTVNFNGVSGSLSGIEIDGNTVTIVLNDNIPTGVPVSIGYLLNPSDSADNLSLTDVTNTTLWVPVFTNLAVTNNGDSIGSPISAVGLLTANQNEINTSLTLVFDQILNADSPPDLSQFQVFNNNQPVTLKDTFRFKNNSIVLTIGQPVRQGDILSVSYTPSSEPTTTLKSSNGLTIPAFSIDQVITTPSSAGMVIKTAFSNLNGGSIDNISSIPGTIGLNFDPVAIFYNNQNIVAWVNVDGSSLASQNTPGSIYDATQTSTINDAINASDIYYSIYDPTTDQWSLAAAIAVQEGQDKKVTLGIGPNGQLMAAWLNTQTINGETNTTIYRSSFNGTSWSTPQIILSDISPDAFTELSISSINGQPAIFWTETQPASYSNLIFNANPLVYLRLGELSGTTAFNVGQLGNTANGTYQYQNVRDLELNQPGALASSTTGDPNPAVLFNNGSGVTLGSPIPFSSQGFTVEFWFKVPTLPSQSLNLLSMLPATGETPAFSLMLNNSTLIFDVGDGGNIQGTGIESNVWNYVVGSYDGTTQALSLYLNGQLLNATTIAIPLPKSGILQLAGGDEQLYLDEVAFYNAPLAQGSNSNEALTAENFANITGQQILNQSFSVNQISDRYNAQYNDPVPSGPEAHYSIWNPTNNSWQNPSQITPIAEIVPTVLADGNNPIWDIVSANLFSSGTKITPNGSPDNIFQVTLNNEQGNDIIGIAITVSDTKLLWGIGQNNSGQAIGGFQIGVIVGETAPNNGQLTFTDGQTLLNSNNPNNSEFSYRIMGETETLNLFIDETGGFGFSGLPTVTVYLRDDPKPLTPQVSAFVNQGGPVKANTPDYLGTQVLGTATITEANDSSLSLIDSGFVINTDNTAIAQVLARGFNGGNLAYVAVGNRGYTDAQGNPAQITINGTSVDLGSTIQILPFQANGTGVLNNAVINPLTTTDLSGNPQGILIYGLTDSGSPNNAAISLATGDVDSDGIDDLVIGNANANNGDGAIYVVYGSYLTQNANAVINIADLAENNTGFTVNGSSGSGEAAGFSVVVGNFDGDSKADIAFGAPKASGGAGQVYLIRGGTQTATAIYPGQTVNSVGEGAGFALGVSRYRSGGASTFTGSTTTDDLIIGAPNYQVNITNQWSGKDSLPSGNQSNYPTTSWISAGAVYVFSSNSSGLSATPVATYTGPTIPDTNGVGANYFAGAAIASGDFTDLDVDGDGRQDLAITAPGVNGNAGNVYIISGQDSVQSSSLQALHQISNLTINGGFPSGKVGTTISSPGDINGDNYQDFLITAPQAVNGTGQSYLLFGSSDFFTNPIIDLSPTANNSNSLLLLNGSLPYQLAGTAAVGVGDINGDGVDDLMLTAPNAQQLYAVYGHRWLGDDGSIKLSDIASDNGFVIDGNEFSTFNVANPAILNQGTSETTALVSYQGTLYMALKGELSNQGIFFTTSHDNGKTWSDAVPIFADGATNVSPSLAVDDQGNLYLAYLGLDPLINIMYSTDGGNNWSPQYVIQQTSNNSPSLVFYQNTLFTFFTDQDNSNILYVYSDNPQSPSSWSSAAEVTYNNGNSNQTSANAVSAAVSNNTLYVAYQTGTQAQPSVGIDIAAATGTDLSQLQWTRSSVPNLTTSQPPILISDGETLYLNSNQFVDESILLSLSTSTNGRDWLQQTLPGGSSYPPAATVSNEELYLVRSTGNTGMEVLSSSLPPIGVIANNGSLVQILGDVNGDGFADVFSGGTQTGAIIFGKSTDALIDAAISTDDLIIAVPNANIKNVISLGDFNGDGFKDFGVLDSNKNFYVVLGDPALGNGGQLTITTALPNISAVTQGFSVGDYNGNGYDDVLLSFGNNGSWVYWGNQAGTLDTNNSFELPTPDRPTSATGIDIDGNGYNDIASGTESREIAGSVSTSGSFGLYSYLPSPNVTFFDTLAAANQLQAIGDFNGDGLEDLAVLASNYYAATLGDPTRLNQAGNQGGVFIYYGTSQGLGSSSNPQPDVILSAPFTTLAGQQSAFQLSTIGQAGDVNGDGFDDLLISSPFTIGSNNNQGSVFVVFGGNNWTNTPFDLGLLSANQQSNGSSAQGFLVEGRPNAQAGIAISGGEDVNGDGFDDLAIGAPGNIQLDYSAQVVVGDKKGGVWYNGEQINSGNNDPAVVTMAVQQTANGKPQVVVGLDNGEVWWYNGSSWSQLNSSNIVNSWSSPINALDVQWNQEAGQPPQVIVGLGEDGGVFLFNGDINNWSTLINSGEGSPVTQMTVQWNENATPQVVVGYQDGTIGSSQNTNNFPQPDSSNSSIPITQLVANWDENGNPEIVIGLGKKGGVEYYNGSSWSILENLSPAWSSPVNQMSVQWNTAGNPQIVVGLQDGAILYYNGSGGFGGLPTTNNSQSLPYPVTQMAVQWNANGYPQIVAALGDKGGVEYYNGSSWITIADANPGWGSPVTQMSVQWGSDGQPEVIVGLDNGAVISMAYDGSGWLQKTLRGVGQPAVTQLSGLWSGSLVNSGNGDNLSYVLFGSDFNDTVNQTGTIGDDVMLGTPTGESFVAGQGDDQIYTGGGIDVVYAGPGDDLVTVSDTYFRRLDGGTGLDTLQFTGYNGQNWDLTTLAPGLRLQDFEVLDLRNYGANQLTLNSVTVTALSSNNILTVLMDINDGLVLSNDFSSSGTVYQDGQNYYQYTSNVSAAKILVNQAIAPSYTAPTVNRPVAILDNSATIAAPPNNAPQNNVPGAIATNPNAPTQLFVDNPRTSEAAGEVNFTIKRTGDLRKYALVSYLTQDGDGKAGDRYLPVAGRLLFAPGETHKIVTVPIPNDNIYTGDRQFGLLVSLLQEGLDPKTWPTSFNVEGDANGEQIRRWNYTEQETFNGLMNGILDFSTTVTSGQAQVNFSSQGIGDFNEFFNYNPYTNQYESLILQENLGATFTYLENNPEDSPYGTKLALKDGDRGDADGVANGLVKVQGYMGRTIPGLVTSNNQLFWAPTQADGQVQWRLVDSPNQNYELGWIPVDDQQGTINGLKPTDAGYETVALARKQVIFENLGSASNQSLTSALAQNSFSDPSSLAQTEQQFFGEFAFSHLEANRFYMLYSQDETQTTFSVNQTPVIASDSRGYHQLTFNGITAEIGSSTLVTPGNLNQPISVETSLSRAAAYQNLIALYRVDSLTGALDTNADRQIDLKPGDVGYVEVALTRAKDSLTGVILTTPEYLGTTQQTVTLLGNNMYGMVVIPNATIDQVLSQNPLNDPNFGPVALFSFRVANPDGISHMARLGANLFGFEDQVGGGDRDYNDMVLQFSFPTL
jgi:hypothetical protein